MIVIIRTTSSPVDKILSTIAGWCALQAVGL